MIKITNFLNKAFDFVKSKVKTPLQVVSHSLTKCAKAYTYVETLGKHSDALHKWIKSSYEEDFCRAFEVQVKKIIKSLRIVNPRLAIDITKEPFYGKTRNFFIFNTPKDYKHRGEFQYVTSSVIDKGKEIPLMALPVMHGQQIKQTIDLIKYCITLFSKIKSITFDRGFYAGELIDFLNSKKINYLIFVPKHRGKIKSYVNDTDNFSERIHRMCYSKNKSNWKPKTRLVVCKNVLNFDWIFATNISFSKKENYVYYYKRRWQIETNYRVEDEARIKSKSSNYMIRFFYFLVSQLFRLLWIVHKKKNFYVQFKKFLNLIEEILFLKIIKSSKF